MADSPVLNAARIVSPSARAGEGGSVRARPHYDAALVCYRLARGNPQERRGAGMEGAPRLRLETVFDFLLLVLGLAICVISWGYGFGNLAHPGPGLFPFFIGAAICIFSFFILVSEWRSQTSKPVLDKQGATILILMTVTFCLWILAMDLLGYVIVTLVATYAFCKILKLEGWRKPLAISVGTALFVYLLFDYWLYIDLPRGILG
jgi:putative tricarboxylic transport membrane protein